MAKNKCAVAAVAVRSLSPPPLPPYLWSPCASRCVPCSARTRSSVVETDGTFMYVQCTISSPLKTIPAWPVRVNADLTFVFGGNVLAFYLPPEDRSAGWCSSWTAKRRETVTPKGCSRPWPRKRVWPRASDADHDGRGSRSTTALVQPVFHFLYLLLTWASLKVARSVILMRFDWNCYLCLFHRSTTELGRFFSPSPEAAQVAARSDCSRADSR